MRKGIGITSVAVVLSILASSAFGAPQVLEVNPTTLDFSAIEGGGNPAAQVLSIWNSGHGPMDWMVTPDCNWLVVEPNSGTSSGEVDDVNVIVDISGLVGGTYNCQITVTGDGADNSPQIVDINLVVDGPVLEVSPSLIEFTALEGGPNPAGQVLSISNSGGGVLNWEISEDCNWLTVEPNTGSSTGEVDDVNISMDITGMKSGDYSSELVVSDPNASNSPQAVIVSLNIYSQGQIYGWGRNDFGAATPPDGNDYVAITAGYTHSLALKSDGSVVGWGANVSGSTIPPDGNDYVAISAGYFHSLALKSDGSMVGFGQNTNVWMQPCGQANPPDGNDFIAIAAGYEHSLALKSDGSIVGWGCDGWGQVTPPDGNDFIAIAAEWNHSLALKSDGSIVGWGGDSYGQATPPDGNDFIAIAAGVTHGLALKSDGSIVGWGRDNYGQATPPEGNDFIAISAGEYHSLALKSDGSIVGWGRDDYGQATPSPGNDFIAIAAGGYHSLALRYVCSYSQAGDLDSDCRVDMFDFAILGEAWMSEAGDLNWEAGCDISEPNDNVIDGLDLEVFVGNWLEGL